MVKVLKSSAFLFCFFFGRLLEGRGVSINPPIRSAFGTVEAVPNKSFNSIPPIAVMASNDGHFLFSQPGSLIFDCPESPKNVWW